MQYGLSQCNSCWMYTAVSVWTTKLAKLSRRNPDAIRYLRRVSCSALRSGLTPLIVGRREWCSMGLPSASPWPRLAFDSRPLRSSLSKGWFARVSAGRCMGGRFIDISSSESGESRTSSGSVISRGPDDGALFEATLSQSSVLYPSRKER